MRTTLRAGILLLLSLMLFPSTTFAQQPTINIAIPLPNEVVSPVQVVVQGTGTALPENNVVIQALDSAGTVLAQQVTTVNAELGGSGPWNAVLDVNTTPGTTGQILAYSTSPADGSIIAQAAVPVSYGQEAVPPTPTPEPEVEQPVAPTEEPEVELPIAPTEEPEVELPVAPTEEPEVELPIAPTEEPEIELPIAPTPPAARPSAIRIRIPLAGEQVSPAEVVVVGDGANLPENNVVVQALDENGNVLDETVTTVNAPLGGAGEWRATLYPDVAPGTNGDIIAFATSPKDGSELARDIVPVAYGSAPVLPTPTAQPTRPAASLSIQIPLSGEVVSPAEVVVVGIGSVLPENNVVVQALDQRGAVLDQVATTVNAPLGGSGEWRALLNPNVAPGTRGFIYAFSPSPKDGSILADATVSVTYGDPAPVPPAITITSPTDGQVVNTTTGFSVSGTATSVFENTVVVRVRDQFGRTIQQGVTTAAADGQWVLSFRFLIENGTPGSIYAFSTSPQDGSISADALVNVTYASSCTLRTDWPAYIVKPGDTTFSIARRTGTSVSELVWANCLYNPNAIYVGQTLYVPRLPGAGILEPDPGITVEAPKLDGELPINTPFQIVGTAIDLPVGHVTVRLLDNMGTVIDEQRVDVSELSEDVAEGEEWAWSVDLLAPDMTSGSRGTILAYSLSPVDGTIVVADQVDVLFGEDDATPFIAIADPMPYTMLDLDEGEIVVSGRGRGLFENNVVVRAVDSAGNILALVPTTMETDEIGGEGIWEVSLPLDVVTRGRLVAFSPSPAEGDEASTQEIEAAVDVFFGDPSGEKSYTVFTYPLPNTVITNQANFYAVAGYASGLQNENVNVIVLDEETNIKLWMPVEVDPVTDFWSTTSPAEGAIEEDQLLSLRVFSPSALDGRVLGSDRIPVVAKRTDAYVSGNIVYRERIALPDDAIVTVRVVNASLMDAPPEQTLEGIQVIEDAGQVPIAFAVGYNTASIDENLMYSLSVRIEDGQGNLLFITKESVPVITNGNPTEDVEVLVESVN